MVLPAESAEAQAAVSNSGVGGAGSVVAETSGGLTINLIFDAAAMVAPASFRAGIEQAAALLSAAISDKITLNFNVDYSGTGGGAAAGPDDGQWLSYSDVRADLVNNATQGDSTFNGLPGGSSIQSQSSVAVWNAQLKLWGVIGANDTTTDDGSLTFATDINSSLLVGVALHELTHAMGRVPYGPQPDIFDFYRFTSSGTLLFSNNIPAPAAYFSLDGGTTKLADYGQNSDTSDFLNSGVQGPDDPFNEYYTSSTLQQLTTVDLQQMDALGFHLTSNTPIVISAFGSTSLAQIGANYFLEPVGGGPGPELKYGGAAVYEGEFGGFAPIGAQITASGYEVAWKVPGTDQYSVWNTDNNGNYVSDAVGVVSGNSIALESLEPSFHQDLNGDGVIGIPSATHPLTTSPAVASLSQSTLDATTLTVEQLTSLRAQIIGFTGNGDRGSDQTDLHGLDLNSRHSNFVSSSGTLFSSDHTTTAANHLLGQDAQDGFHFADDGNDGTLIAAATSSSQTGNQASNPTAHGSFVFAPDLGQVTPSNSAPATDTLHYSKTVSADVATVPAATHDDASGNAFIASAAHDTIALQHVTTAQSQADLNDFHIV
ncbi:hypothetical protein AS156_24550 [Bradyrhizobium macuxiense]|uniref:Tryptophan-rich domain-containing protein n=1 Tax=Bradyrhizobium macuxiense TaxID=1755647 RepID=A0A109J7T7_9BRAD|nr:hypothetical protein AS156_24550 [Bradyrhizobium macuxiense]